MQAQAAEADLKPLMELMKEALGDRVEKVVATQRLADSPCALATSKFGWSAYQERIMRSQVLPCLCLPVCMRVLAGNSCQGAGQRTSGGLHGGRD